MFILHKKNILYMFAKYFCNPWRNATFLFGKKVDPSWNLCLCYTSAQETAKHPSKKHKGTTQLKSEKALCQPVLEHFDQQYSRELGNLWTSAREVLLNSHSWQYGVVLNRFAAVSNIIQTLKSKGFVLLQTETSSLCEKRPTQSCLKQPGENASILSSECLSDDSNLQSTYASQRLQAQPSQSPLLQCYIHPYPLRFPSQGHRPSCLKQYYLLNAASLLPVLALRVKDGENILDLCSAPGGKALAIMQSCNPALLCCNEPDTHRREWLAKTLNSFLPPSLNGYVAVSGQDGRHFGQSETSKYDKVLVDAPCSNDRSWLYSPDGLQVEQRLRERAMLPDLQTQLLKSALSAVRPGGTVVYSTCTLSSAENCSVVEAVLGSCPEAELEDLWEELVVPLSEHFCFRHGQADPPQCGTMAPPDAKLGILVVPQPGKTWGPMFLSRIRRKL
ncbi:tRNA (cytosine(34)-C(5))-methyltransferase, mitochondrial [Eucyclogobius newberryi]|uniref:tRNA (cytosine(34)-C(5))-methyltransferase, mitochondrial n=1 Tax=Eucyclogobius newberryi TaxID=166745 RepID=UPI003B5B2095